MNSYEFMKSMNTDAKQTEALFFGWALFKFLNKSLEIRSEIVASWRQEHLKKHVESNFTADKMVLAASGLAADGETWVRPGWDLKFFDGYVPFQKGLGHMR